MTTYREVIPMDVRTRILALRLMEMIRNDPLYAQSLGIKVDLKNRVHV